MKERLGICEGKIRKYMKGRLGMYGAKLVVYKLWRKKLVIHEKLGMHEEKNRNVCERKNGNL